MRRRPRWPWSRPPAEHEEEPGPAAEERHEPIRTSRPQGPAGFYWEGLGLPPERPRRGPKNYRRSDAHLHDEVCDRLTADHHVDATGIEVRVEDGIVYLRGLVADRAQKRRAERIAERAYGVEDVMNELRIRRERPAERPALPQSNGEGRA